MMSMLATAMPRMLTKRAAHRSLTYPQKVGHQYCISDERPEIGKPSHGGAPRCVSMSTEPSPLLSFFV